MEDLSSRINQILNDPQSMQLIQSMAQNLGLNQNPAAEPSTVSAAPLPAAAPQQSPPAIDMGQLSSLLSQLGMGNPAPAQPQLPSLDLNTMMQIQRAMQLFTQNNKNVDLLRSLRPLLSQTRQKKVDDAIRIMQLIQMLPLLKESGLFGFGGDSR